MRVLDHHCARVIPEHPSTVNCDLVCSCGAAFAGSYCDAVDAFTAHVIGAMLVAEAQQRPLRRSELVRGLEANHGRRWWRRGRAL